MGFIGGGRHFLLAKVKNAHGRIGIFRPLAERGLVMFQLFSICKSGVRIQDFNGTFE